MTTFTPISINAKASKAGKTYWEVETEQGKATVFDYPIVQELEKSIGKPISLYDLEQNEKGYINIRPAKQIQPKPILSQVHETQAKTKTYDTTSMYVSYAKDLFICLKPTEQNMQNHAIMDIAIELIKEAKKAFI